MKPNVINRCYGFTLIELMIAIVVFSILASIAIPSYQIMITNNRLTSQVNNLVTSLNLARSEAIKRGSSVTVTANAGGWAAGWTVTDASANILRAQAALRDNSTLVEAGGATSITFGSRGFPTSGSSLTFNLCNTKTTRDKQLSVAPGGGVNLNPSHDCGD